MLRSVFMGTPEFSVPSLRALHAQSQVLAVFTQPDRPKGRHQNIQLTPVKVVAQELGLPVFQPGTLKDPKLIQQIQTLKPDLILVIAYGKILGAEILKIPRFECLNLHASLLPRWRGAAPIAWSLLEGDSETGITLMRMTPELDAGEMLLQKKLNISSEETAGSLHDRLAVLAATTLEEGLQLLQAGSLKGVSQNQAAVTYAPKLSRQMQWLDPKTDAKRLERQVRALNPWPGCSLQIKGLGRLKVYRAHVLPRTQLEVGSVDEEIGQLVLGTARGGLSLVEIQWEGKPKVNPFEFLNGLRGKKVVFPLEVQVPENLERGEA